MMNYCVLILYKGIDQLKNMNLKNYFLNLAGKLVKTMNSIYVKLIIGTYSFYL